MFWVANFFVLVKKDIHCSTRFCRGRLLPMFWPLLLSSLLWRLYVIPGVPHCILSNSLLQYWTVKNIGRAKLSLCRLYSESKCRHDSFFISNISKRSHSCSDHPCNCLTFWSLEYFSLDTSALGPGRGAWRLLGQKTRFSQMESFYLWSTAPFNNQRKH